MPDASQFNPFTFVIEAERALLSAAFTSSTNVWAAFADGITAIIRIAVGIYKLMLTVD